MSESRRARIDFARWRSASPSGGNRYDDELAGALRAMGQDLYEHDVTGPWPHPHPSDRERLTEVLTAGDGWLVDNIVGSAAPEVIRAAVAAGVHVTLLMHYFPSDDTTLAMLEREQLAASEAAAVTAASSVVVTSAWTAAEVSRRYARHDVVVAEPGARPAEVAPGSVHAGHAPMLLWLARLTSQKDPITFVDALTLLPDLDWNAQLVGPDSLDGDLSEEVHSRIAEAGLNERMKVVGPQTGDSLESLWLSTDLLVHTSRSETYGMVISEALARGIPSVVAAGTGAVEAHRVGSMFPQGDAAALSSELRAWMTDPELQKRWRANAVQLRAHLPTWADTARVIASTFTR